MQTLLNTRDGDLPLGGATEALFVLTRTRDGTSTEALRVYDDLPRALAAALALSRSDPRGVFRIVRGDRRTLLVVVRGRVHPVHVARRAGTPTVTDGITTPPRRKAAEKGQATQAATSGRGAGSGGSIGHRS